MLADDIIDALNAIFGKQDGHRAAHAKGIVCEGTFRPAPTAPLRSAARPTSRARRRRSRCASPDNTGVIGIPDSDPNAMPHGFAVKFHLPGGATTDLHLARLQRLPGVERRGVPRVPARGRRERPGRAEAVADRGLRVAASEYGALPGGPKPIPASFATERSSASTRSASPTARARAATAATSSCRSRASRSSVTPKPPRDRRTSSSRRSCSGSRAVRSSSACCCRSPRRAIPSTTARSPGRRSGRRWSSA